MLIKRVDERLSFLEDFRARLKKGRVFNVNRGGEIMEGEGLC